MLCAGHGPSELAATVAKQTAHVVENRLFVNFALTLALIILTREWLDGIWRGIGSELANEFWLFVLSSFCFGEKKISRLYYDAARTRNIHHSPPPSQ